MTTASHPTANHMVVWIDHTEARIFAIARDGAAEWRVAAPSSASHIHHKAGGGDTGKTPTDQHYLHAVVEAVKDAPEILIVGPGTAKSELKAHIERHDPQVAKKIVAVEPMDHPTDGQLIAAARKFFAAADRMRS